MASLLNKVKEVLHVDQHPTTGTHTGTQTGSHNTTTTGTAHGAGPHSSAAGNVVDPRVDSSTGAHHGTAGPHNSDLLNKLDPRVDSDRDGSTTAGRGQTGTGLTGTHTTHHTGTGVTGLQGNSHVHRSEFLNEIDPRVHSTTHQTAGPHNSDLLNKVDPRVDSDRDGSRNLGASGHTNTGITGQRQQHTAGPQTVTH